MTAAPSIGHFGSLRPSRDHNDRFAQTGDQPQRRPPVMRRFEVVHLAPNGDIADFARVAPAMEAFEEAFSAFARGTLFQTEDGPRAVEDLLPGDRVKTADRGFQPLIWKGSCSLIANIPEQASKLRSLVRVSADSLGFGRPGRDIVLGPSARLFHSSEGVRTMTGRPTAVVPVRDFADGVNIVDLTPQTAVQVYHLGFEEQERLVADGIELESFHPGPVHRLPLRGDLLDLYLSFFPHIPDLMGFGAPRFPRLRLADLDLFSAA
ncbi:Hint domain-containing protein [Loktanella sp. IMCC34160]|uniref:Hint domain-containing protein n=1 Tax=Loktanella sp. IMCC34160 TaxID=2510646 RepID=UPI001F5E1134|nr:Hint domain-containing protein [Loktanella sp. IMCC34160]